MPNHNTVRPEDSHRRVTSLKLSDNERKILREAAAMAGLEFTSYMRKAAMQKAKTDLNLT